MLLSRLPSFDQDGYRGQDPRRSAEAEDESYAAWLLSGDGIIPFPPEFRTYPAQDFAAKVLNRVAESLTIGSRDLTLEPDLEFLMYD